MKPAAESIDTIGWLARSLDDIELLTAVLSMRAPEPPRTMNSAPRIGLCRTEMWDTAQPETKAAVEGAAAALAKAGATVREVKLPDPFTGLRVIARETINFHERAACMAYEWDHHRDALSPQMRRYIENGQKTSRQDYVAGWRRVEECRALLAVGVRRASMCCWRHACRAKRPRASLRPATAPCRRSGRRCTRRA